MFTGSAKELTDLSRRFTEPANATHRQYEALRAYFVEGLSGVEAAAASATPRAASASSSTSSARTPTAPSSSPRPRGRMPPRKADPAPRSDRRAAQAEPLRSTTSAAPWHDEGEPLSPVAVAPILKAEGFARLPRRADDERPTGTPARHGRCRRRPAARPDPAATAAPSSAACSCSCPTLASIPFDRIARQARLARIAHDPGRLRPALPAGPEALRQRAPPPRHELRARRGAGPLRRVERHPQAVLPDRVQLPHRPGLLPEVDAPLVRCHERARASNAGRRSTSTSTPSPSTATTPWSRSTTSPSGAAARRGCWPSSPRTPTPASSATPTPSCARTEQNDEVLRFVEFWKRRTGRLPGGTDLRLQADDLRQPRQAEPAWGSTSSPCGGGPPKLLDEIAPDARRRPGGGSSWRASRGRTRRRASSTAGSRLSGLRRPPPAVDRRPTWGMRSRPCS